MTKLEVLKKYFGHQAFRGGQEQLVDHILRGGDCLGVMPTGAGKSVCYQVPAMLLDGTALVISPLISLMQDQVDSLIQNGISAACINSGMDAAVSREVWQKAAAGRYKLLYAAPERLETDSFRRLCEQLVIPLVAVDESHCVSQWGQDFRPSYLKIASFVESLCEHQKRPVVAAFTATATDIVKRDIVKGLGLREPFTITTGFDRPNLYFEVREPESKDEELLKILRDSGSGSAIVYCSTRKNVEYVCAMLRRNGYNAGQYHAGFSAEDRKRVQDDFIYDRLDVIVATNAFGMGIDKSNVTLVVHYNMPKDPESYYQEAGRAGRDGGEARCILLYGYEDVRLAEFLIDISHNAADRTEKEAELLKKPDRIRLRKMQGYCKTSGCLRSYILNYFGEKAPAECGKCGNCTKGFDEEDVTVEAQKILSCIFRLKQRELAFGKAMVCRILLGSRDRRIFENGCETLSTYGIMSGVPRVRVNEIMDYLEREGYFETVGEYAVCALTPKADEFVKSKRRLVMLVRGKPFRRAAELLKKPAVQQENPELFEQLKALRKKLAGALGVPPYVVFSDASLRSMCAILPKNNEEFLRVSGVGTIKAERYGKKFMEVIENYLSNQRQQSKS